jgi:hypothetical protein
MGQQMSQSQCVDGLLKCGLIILVETEKKVRFGELGQNVTDRIVEG